MLNLFPWLQSKDRNDFQSFSVKSFENLKQMKDGFSRKYEKQGSRLYF